MKARFISRRIFRLHQNWHFTGNNLL